ncbi:Mobile element protein [Dickeya dianthicola RNS04.9]|nr:Mobile element protein [Dickeya dianthicola RNS04.9]
MQREFTVVKPNQVWVTDITYIRTWQGWPVSGGRHRSLCP